MVLIANLPKERAVYAHMKSIGRQAGMCRERGSMRERQRE